MDWKFKHFAGGRLYPQPEDQVLATARAFVAETLGWRITDTADGFQAQGVSFSHAAVARFHAGAEPPGGRLSIELAVERAGLMGFMLFDVGGYYNGQIGRWLDGIGDRLEGRVGEAAPHRPPSAGARLMSWMIVIAVVGFGVWGAWTLVFGPVIGIFTGVLYLPGRGGELTLHGAWARGVSAGLLALDALIVVRLLRPSRQRPPKVLG